MALTPDELRQAKSFLTGAHSANAELRGANADLKKLIEEARIQRELERRVQERPQGEPSKQERRMLRERRRTLQQRSAEHAAMPVCAVIYPAALAAELSKAANDEDAGFQAAAVAATSFAESWRALLIAREPAPENGPVEARVPCQPVDVPAYCREHLHPSCPPDFWGRLHCQDLWSGTSCGSRGSLEVCPSGEKFDLPREAAATLARLPDEITLDPQHYQRHVLPCCPRSFWERLHCPDLWSGTSQASRALPIDEEVTSPAAETCTPGVPQPGVPQQGPAVPSFGHYYKEHLLWKPAAARGFRARLHAQLAGAQAEPLAVCRSRSAPVREPGRMPLRKGRTLGPWDWWQHRPPQRPKAVLGRPATAGLQNLAWTGNEGMEEPAIVEERAAPAEREAPSSAGCKGSATVLPPAESRRLLKRKVTVCSDESTTTSLTSALRKPSTPRPSQEALEEAEVGVAAHKSIVVVPPSTDEQHRSLVLPGLVVEEAPLAPSIGQGAARMQDPRPAAEGSVCVLGFSEGGSREQLDQLCRAGFLRNSWEASLVLAAPSGGQMPFASAEAAFRALHGAEVSRHASEDSGSSRSLFKVEEECPETTAWRGMASILEAKFRPGSELAEGLLATKDAFLLSLGGGKVWGDAGTGEGRNGLGLQLMLLRDRLSGQAGWTDFAASLLDLETGSGQGMGAATWQHAVRSARRGLALNLPLLDELDEPEEGHRRSRRSFASSRSSLRIPRRPSSLSASSPCSPSSRLSSKDSSRSPFRSSLGEAGFGAFSPTASACSSCCSPQGGGPALAPSFAAEFAWAPGSSCLGLKFRKPKLEEEATLVVREVLPEGAAAERNLAKAKAGRWDEVIRAEMHVTEVDGAAGHAAGMLGKVRESLQTGALRLCLAAATGRSPSKSSHVHAPEPESCASRRIWDIALIAEPDGPGFATAPIREFLGPAAPDGLAVTGIFPGGSLARWNEQNPQHKVKKGDFLLEANGLRGAERLRRQLTAPALQLRFARHAEPFQVLLEKGGQELGVVFKRPACPSVHELLIVEVAAGGAVAQHNARAAGQWELAVRAGMCVVAVNGVSGDLEAMRRSLQSCEVAELRLRRSTVFQTKAAAAVGPPSAPLRESLREAERLGLAHAFARARATSGQFTEEPAAVESSLDGTRWEVSLDSLVPESPAGFGTRSLRELLAGLEEAPDLLVVSEIAPVGPLASWNSRSLETAVKVGDVIQSVDGSSNALQMQRRLAAPSSGLRMQLLRQAAHFSVCVEKAGQMLGVDFRRPVKATLHELLVLDVDPKGAVALHNRLQAGKGRWDLAVLPQMCVVMVNGIEGDVDRMLEALRSSPKVELRIRRGLAQRGQPGSRPASPTPNEPTAKSSPKVHAGLRSAMVEVCLQQTGPKVSEWHGLQVLNAQDELGSKAGVMTGPHGMVVDKILPTGALARWNLEHPEACVSVGDWICHVNGKSMTMDMEHDMAEETELRLGIVRFARCADITVRKAAKEFGLTFKRPKSGLVHELLIIELAASGAVARHNTTQALSGRWDLLILPKMCIQGVNGIEGDVAKMMDALRTCEIVELRVRRAGQAQIRPQRVASLGLAALRALQAGAASGAREEPARPASVGGRMQHCRSGSGHLQVPRQQLLH